MNKRQLVFESFERCDAQGAFADTFYKIFLSKSQEIRDMFKNTNFPRQKKLLRASVYILVLQDITTPKAQNIMSKIGATHSRSKLDIPPRLYPVWLDSLCETIATHDPDYSETLEAHWREIMSEPIRHITNQY